MFGDELVKGFDLVHSAHEAKEGGIFNDDLQYKEMLNEV
jgi:hypothetical protein